MALATEGAIPAAVKLRAKFPAGLIEMTRLPGSAPKRARRLFDELGTDSLAALQTAAEEHRIRSLKGFGPKAEEGSWPDSGRSDRGAHGHRVVLDRALAEGRPWWTRCAPTPPLSEWSWPAPPGAGRTASRTWT